MTVKDLRAFTKGVIDSVTNLKVEVDGQNANDLLQRVQSLVSEIALPEDMCSTLCGGPGTVPSGVYSPVVDDGFYVIIEPLKVGDIRFTSMRRRTVVQQTRHYVLPHGRASIS